MGYNGEKASLNQYTSLYDYCKDRVFSDLKSIFTEDEIEQNKLEISDIPYYYQPKQIKNTVPLVSFDGGLANLFSGSQLEVSLIKVAGACPPEFEKIIDNKLLKEIIFHVFTGKLSHCSNNSELIKKEIFRLGSLDEFVSFLAFSEIDFNEFYLEFKRLIDKWRDKTALKDSVRELLEWSLIFDFFQKMKELNNSDYLIIKDGSLSVNAKALTGLVSNKIKNSLMESGDKLIPIIGVVKKSRFVGETPIGRIVSFYSARLPSHTFFKIPAKYESVMNKDLSSNAFSRYFLSLFGGSSIFEIQIPKPIDQSVELREKIFNILAENTTFSYGGSVSINSFAHIKASLSESDSLLLEKNLYRELKKDNPGDKK